MIETEDLTPEQAAAELERIAAEMAKSDIAYYQNDAPYLTDAEYGTDSRRQPVQKSRRRGQKRIRQNSAPFSHAFAGRRLQP